MIVFPLIGLIPKHIFDFMAVLYKNLKHGILSSSGTLSWPSEGDE